MRQFMIQSNRRHCEKMTAEPYNHNYGALGRACFRLHIQHPGVQNLAHCFSRMVISMV